MANSQEITCLVVGDESVGKSSLIACKLGKDFSRDHEETDCFKRHNTECTVDGRTFRIKVFDSPSEEDYYQDMPAYPKADVLLLCFAIDCRASFDNVRERWHKIIGSICPSAKIILVGTKADLREGAASFGRPIGYFEGRSLAKTIKATCYKECSALNKQTVNDLFNEIVFTHFDSKKGGKRMALKLFFWKKSKSSNTLSEVPAVGAVGGEEVYPEALNDHSVYIDCDTNLFRFNSSDSPSTSSTDQQCNLKSGVQAASLEEFSHYDEYEYKEEDPYEGIYDAIEVHVDKIKKLESEPQTELQTEPQTGKPAMGITQHTLTSRPLPEVTTSPTQPEPASSKNPPPLPDRGVKLKNKTVLEKRVIMYDNLPQPANEAILKLIVVGDESVGKTCLLLAYAEGICPLEYVPTETDDCLMKEVQVNGDKIGIGLWDLSGSRDFDRMRPENYRQTDAILICFSVASPATFDSVGTRWKPEVNRFSPDTPIILVGTKADLRDDRAAMEKLRRKGLSPISRPEASELAKEIGAELYVECSALLRQGLDAVFFAALQAALESQRKILESKTAEGNAECICVEPSKTCLDENTLSSAECSDDEDYLSVDVRKSYRDKDASGSKIGADDPAESNRPYKPAVAPHPIPKPRKTLQKEPFENNKVLGEETKPQGVRVVAIETEIKQLQIPKVPEDKNSDFKSPDANPADTSVRQDLAFLRGVSIRECIQ